MIEVSLVRAVGHQRRISRRVLGDKIRIDFPFGLEPPLCLTGPSIRRQRPHQPAIFGPVAGHDDLEHPPFARRVEVRRLTSIGGRIEVVLRPDRDVELLLGVAVEIPEVERVGAVGILLPSIERRADVLSAGVRGRLRVDACADRPAEQKNRERDQEQILPHSCCPFSVSVSGLDAVFVGRRSLS